MKYIFLISLFFTLQACIKPSGIRRVWAIDDGEKIKQEDIIHWHQTQTTQSGRTTQ
jgi:hypothetical protein